MSIPGDPIVVSITADNYKMRLIDSILDRLFIAEERRLSDFIQKMQKRNQEAYGKPLDGFHYRGSHYVIEGRRGRLTKAVLHRDLEPEMDAYRVDYDQVMCDRQLIRQCLFLLMNPVGFGPGIPTVQTVKQEYRDALPDCLTDMLPDWARNLSRMREAAFTIKNVPRSMKTYVRTLPKIEFYSATRLLY